MDDSPKPGDVEADPLERRMLAIADLPAADREAAAESFCQQHPELAESMRAILADVGRGTATPVATLESERADWARELPEVRYAIEEEIAQGGMGVILRARDQAIRRELAMKVTRGQWRSGRPVEPAVLRRFLAEARVTGQLEHPGVVPVHDLGVDPQGRVYFTMRLVRGRTAGEVFELARTGRDGWRFERTLEVLVKVCDTLAYAHSRGVVHRDLKPSNVMVGDFGEVYVMDWGLAKVVADPARAPDAASAVSPADSDPRLTCEGDVVGTPSFMPPEQARGEVAKLGPQADVYAVGAMLYALLTGHAPYLASGRHSSSAAVLDAVRRGPPEPIASLDPRAPPELIAIAEKAMHREIGRRYASMAAMAADLRAFLDGRVVRAFRTGAWAELRSWVRRNKGLASGIAVAILAVVGGLVVVTLALGREQVARQQAQADRAKARYEQYVAELGSVAAALRDNETVSAIERLEDCPAEHRGFEWGHLRLSADSSTSITRLATPGTLSLAVLDASRLVVGRDNGLVEIVEQASGRTLATLAGHTDHVQDLATTPDGRVISASFDGTLRVFKADAAECERKLTDHRSRVWGVAVAPDGRRVASASQDATARIWSLDTGKCEVVLRGHRQGLPAVAWFPDGGSVATASTDGTCCVWNAATGERTRELSSPGEQFYSVAVSPDGAALAAGTEAGTVSVWDLRGDKAATVLRGHQARVHDCLYSPEGSYLVTGSRDRSIRVWDRNTLRCLGVRRGHRRTVQRLAMAADRGHVLSVSSDGELRSWSLDFDPSSTTLVGHRGYARTVAVSADGRFAASGGQDHAVRIWDLATATCTRVLRGHSEMIHAAAFLGEPNGSPPRRILTGSYDHTARLWDLETGECLATMKSRRSGVVRVAEAQGLDALVTVDDLGGVWLWDRTGAQLGCVTDAAHQGSLSALMPQGRLAFSPRSSGPVIVLDLVARRPVAEFGADLPRRASLAVSPDGARIFVGLVDGRIVALDARDGRQVATVQAHPSDVTSLVVSRDGTRLASLNQYDSTLRLFDPASLDQIAAVPLGDHVQPQGLAMTGDGSSILVAGDSGVVVLRAAVDRRAAAVLAASIRSTRRGREELGRLRLEGIVLPSDARAALAASAALDPEVRAAALGILDVEGDDPQAWLRSAWLLALLPTRPAAVYPRVLSTAQAAAAKLPAGHLEAILTVGAAELRCGRAQAAVQTLSSFDPSIAKSREARWLALVALAHLAANDRQKAESAARRLRRVRSTPQGNDDLEANLLAEEVEKRLRP